MKIPPVPKKPRRIITAAQFDRLYQALPDADTQLLIETDIESGLRWGELTELRVRRPGLRDLHPDREPRRRGALPRRSPRRRPLPGQGLPQGQGVPAVQAQPADRQQDRGHIAARGLGDDDLLFTYQAPQQSATRTRSIATAPPPGLTEPNEKAGDTGMAH